MIKRGIIYCTFDWIIQKLYYLNLVELFKFICIKINVLRNEDDAKRLGTDIFILGKWIFLCLLWTFTVNNLLLEISVWYLIIMNIYTYFYYHTWFIDVKKKLTLDRIKRRFLNLLMSISFNITCFAYLYAVPYSDQFSWKRPYSTLIESMNFSLSSALTANYGNVTVKYEFGNNLVMVETLISFIFLAIILSNSIPQPKTD